MATEYILCETLPYRYSPRSAPSGSALHPYDNYDTLTRSMRELTRYADHIARALADKKEVSAASKQTPTDSKLAAASQSPSTHLLDLLLHPSIDWKETADGFVLTAATPGLRKEELKVELLEASDAWYIEVACQTAAALSHQPKDDSNNSQAPQPNNKSEPLEPRLRYASFSEKVRLPRGVDREAMRATYDNGLLVVTIPRAKAEGVKRQKIAIS